MVCSILPVPPPVLPDFFCFFVETVEGIALTTIMVWLLAVALFNLVPLTLQIPLFNLVRCFFALLLNMLGRNRQKSVCKTSDVTGDQRASSSGAAVTATKRPPVTVCSCSADMGTPLASVPAAG